MPTIKDEGVVVRVWDFSETSQTAWVFTRGHGVVRGLAKGAKRPRAKFSGGLDLLTLGEAVAIVKPSTDLAELIEWDLREVFRAARRRLAAHHAAMYFVDLVGHAITDRDPHERLYEALVAGLRRLEHAADDAPAMLRLAALEATVRFQWSLLSETGYRPQLHRDVLTGEALREARSYGFAVEGGGLTSDPGARAGESVLRVRAETVATLRAAEAEWGGETAGALGEDGSVERAARLLAHRINCVLGREPGSQRALLRGPAGSRSNPSERG